MFGIGPMEMLVIIVVAVIFVGPDKLPDMLKKFGRFYVQAKRHANDVKSGFDDAIHQAERELELERIRDLQRQLANLSNDVIDATHTDRSSEIVQSHLDDGHTEDGRLIETAAVNPEIKPQDSALPPGELQDQARAHEGSYHEGHLPPHKPKDGHDAFEAAVERSAAAHHHDAVAVAGVEPVKVEDKK
ncbi:MAG: twin-arginine translocase subunit TatB [Chitinophagaceae bacterium]|nr:twin-arginine translocase subunit TatB [Oligoflexus sp.]